MKTLIPFAVTVLLAATAVAQTHDATPEGPLRVDPETGNVVFQDANSETDRWKGSVNVGGTLSEGNTVRRTASAGANAVRRGDGDRLTLSADWNYADQKDATTGARGTQSQRRLRGFGKYDYFLNEAETTYVYGSISAENDKFSDLDLRLIVSAGVGMEVIQEENLSLSAEVGLAYYQEDRKIGLDDDYLAARLAYHLEWAIKDGVDLIQDVEYIPGLESGDDAYVRKDTRLKVALTDDMFSMFQWVLDYDNTPAAGFERVDHLFLVSIGMNFGAAE